MLQMDAHLAYKIRTCTESHSSHVLPVNDDLDRSGLRSTCFRSLGGDTDVALLCAFQHRVVV